ncbi:hypothetical protein KAR10_01115, partial [bacterium]|nr:hypothetical protein [bacterium]
MKSPTDMEKVQQPGSTTTDGQLITTQNQVTAVMAQAETPMAANRAIKSLVKQLVRLEPEWTQGDLSNHSPIGYRMMGIPEQISKAMGLISSTMIPATGANLGIELERLEAMTKQRAMTPKAQAMQRTYMLEELMNVPADLAIYAMRAWIHQPDKSKAMWFPAWAELEEFFEDALQDRVLMLRACEGNF